MELFSVTCITCRTRLKVRHESAIGQILACPKCNGMVQIEPPAGWKPPAKSTAPQTRRTAEAATAEPQSATPQHSAAGDALLAPPGMIVAPHEALARRWILIGGGVLAAIIISFGLGSTFSRRDDPPVDDSLAAATPTPSASYAHSATATEPSATSAGTPSASPAATVNPSPSPTLVAAATPSATPVPAPTPSASPPPVVTASASPSVPLPPPGPTATAAATMSVPPPTASATPSPPIAAPSSTAPLAPPPQVDVVARLADKIPEIAFDKTSLRQALTVLSQLSTLRVNYDADSLAAADVRLDDPLTLKLSDVTVAEAFAQLSAERGLQYRAVDDQLVVFAPAKEAVAPATVLYAVDDLVGNDEKATTALGELVRRFAAPNAWDPKWGGKLAVAPGKIDVTQSPAGQREVALFLDQLRVARGKTPKSSQPTLDTRFRRARETLEQPVTMNFRPGATLAEIAARIEATTGATILIDYLSLSTQGFFGADRIGIAADKHPAAGVLTALCEPRDWAWRIVGPKLLEITTRDAVRRRPYVEFYSLPAAPAGEADGPGWVTRIRTQLIDEPWRDAPGSDPALGGEAAYDEISRRLIVRQHQGAQLRIERLLAETTKPTPAVPAPRPSATPTASATIPAAVPAATAQP